MHRLLKPALAVTAAGTLFAIGGVSSAVAGGLIHGDDIARNTITASNLAKDSVGRSELKPGVVTDGRDGANGKQGPAGATGAAGATGPAGAAGPAGTDGAVGPKGADGAVGPKGADGAVGPRGADGATGARGADGATGARGADGATGPMGADGATGPKGADGATGPMGANGAPGPMGADGAPGQTGPAGPTGPAGATGLAGAFYAVAFYDVGDTNAGAIATVACDPDNTVSQNYTAISGGVQTLGLDGGQASPVASSFPGRMDFSTNTPKANRLDGWIIQFDGTQDQAPMKTKIWALCVPTTDVTVKQTYTESS